MVRGFEQNQQRLSALGMLGKDLARRAHSKCELCEASGVKFKTLEVSPVPTEPDIDHCLLVCEQCHAEIHRKGLPDPRYWRCLENSAWKELPVIQVTAVRLLRTIGEPWTEQLLEQLYLWPETEAWLENDPD